MNPAITRSLRRTSGSVSGARGCIVGPLKHHCPSHGTYSGSQSAILFSTNFHRGDDVTKLRSTRLVFDPDPPELIGEYDEIEIPPVKPRFKNSLAKPAQHTKEKSRNLTNA
jgi:hypothetical protein